MEKDGEVRKNHTPLDEREGCGEKSADDRLDSSVATELADAAQARLKLGGRVSLSRTKQLLGLDS
mgnify:CR=1 FL=1